MRNRLKKEVLFIIILSIIVTIILNLTIQYVSDRYYDNEIDDYILKMINENRTIDRAVIEQMDDVEFTRSMMINLLSIGICGLLFWLFIKKKTKYIKELSDSLIYIGEGNLDYRVPLRENNELTDLANSINELSIAFKDRIEKEKEQSVKERNFIVGISHDIRTPLTTIMGYLHIIKDEQYQTIDEKNQYMDTTIEKVYQLKGLTDILLDDSTDIRKFYPIDLIDSIDFCKKTIGRITTELDSQYNVVQTNGMDSSIDVFVSCLDRVIENIISNIQKYADPAVPIELNLKKMNNHIELSIVNGCFEDYSDVVDRFTDRFYRADDSRELTKGHGLGLSICKNIMESNNGYFKVEAYEKKLIVRLGFLFEQIDK